MQITTKVNNQIGEKVYRNLKDRLSYSNQKTYATNRSKFYKECIMGIVPEKEETVSTIVGNITHVLLADIPGEFDDKFHISTQPEPSGQLLELCNELYKRSIRTMVDGVQQDKFEVIFQEAVNAVKYDYNLKEVKFVGKNLEKILELFSTTDKNGVLPEAYYKEKMSCVNKTVVTIGQIQAAEKLVEQLKTHKYTADIVNLKTGDGIEVFNELIVLYEIGTIPYRSMIDKLVVDHNQKLIRPWDYKTSWSNEEGFEYVYLKNMYHLQVGLYHQACVEWAMEHGYGDYSIDGMRYITADTTGNNAPVIYGMTADDVVRAQTGFSVRGRWYPGVMEIHKAIQWGIETGIWDTSQKIYEANGRIGLEMQYDQ